MTNHLTTNLNNQNKPNPKPRSLSVGIRKVIRELIAVVVWVYFGFKNFVYDIDVLIINLYFPKFNWVLDFKFFILCGAGAVILLLSRYFKLTPAVLYVIFYPFTFLWRVPFFIFKQRSWILAFASVNFLVSLYKYGRYNFIIFSLFAISACVLLAAKTTPALVAAIFLMSAIIVATYIKQFILVLRPATLFKTYKNLAARLSDYMISSQKLDEAMHGLALAEYSPNQMEKWQT